MTKLDLAFVPAAIHQTTSTRALLGPAGPSFPQAMHQTASGLTGSSFGHGMHQLTSTITASSPAGPSRLAMPNISGQGINLRPSPASYKEDSSRYAPQTYLNQTSIDRRGPYLNPNAPKFEPRPSNQPGLSLNPTTTISEPILANPTSVSTLPQRSKKSYTTSKDTPPELRYLARDIGRMKREIQGGKANTDPALKISLTAYISYIEELAGKMEEVRGTRRLYMPNNEEPGAS
jgi:hypothetical protein